MDINKKEQTFELRSEKVRSIVGQIPSALLRYGIIVIGGVLLCLLAVVYFLPYRQIYSGTAIIPHVENSVIADSINTTVHLKFEQERPNYNINGQLIHLQSSTSAFTGKIISLSSVRDTLDRQKAICRFNPTEIKAIEYQTVNFQIVLSHGNILQKLLGK